MLNARRDAWFAAALTVAAAFSIFRLPFLLPPAQAPVVSASLAGGFNNRVATIAAICLALSSFAITLCCRPKTPETEQAAHPQLSRRALLAGSFGLTAWYVLLGGLAYLGDLRSAGEAHYFLTQMTTASAFHLPLYRGVEFAYGPLLFYPPMVLKPLFSFSSQPLQAAYLFTLLSSEFLGAHLLGWSINQLPISLPVRRTMYILLLTLATLDLGLGLNYTLLRFILPVASLLFCVGQARTAWRLAVLVVIAELLNLGLSPEMGAAFAAGVVTYALLRVGRFEFGFLLVTLAPLAALVAFLGVFGSSAFSTMKLFSSGTYNLIVEPQWYMLLFLVALIWLAPRAVASLWWNKDEESRVWTALLISGVALVPAALGRADAGHVLLNGIPILMLSLLGIRSWSPKSQITWLAALAFAIGVLAESAGIQYIHVALLARRYCTFHHSGCVASSCACILHRHLSGAERGWKSILRSGQISIHPRCED